MKALKSELAKAILKSGIRMPLQNGDKITFKGVTYIVKKVPKAN